MPEEEPVKHRKSREKQHANLKRFPKGVSGNPAGRPPDVLGRQMRQLTAQEFAEIANLIVKGSIEELRKIVKDESQSAIKVMVAATAVKIISKGDMHSLDILLNRLVGKVKDQIEHSGSMKLTKEQLDQEIIDLAKDCNLIKEK